MSAPVRDSLLLGTLAKAQRLLIALLPARIRDEYGHELADTFTDQVGAALSRGRIAALRTGLAELADLALVVVLRGGRRGPVRRSSAAGLGRWFDGLGLDLRHALRRLRSGECLLATAILAAGTAAALTVFALFDTALLKPLPYPDPERLAVIGTVRDGRTGLGTLSPSMFSDLRKRAETFELFGAGARWTFVVNGAGDPEQIRGAYVSAELLPILGAGVALGRGFDPEDHRPDATATVVLTHGLWQRSFGGDAGVVGATLRLNDRPFTVIGITAASVIAPEALHLDGVELWVPMNQFPGRDDSIFLFEAIGRLAEGVTLASARERLAALGPPLIAEHGMERRLAGIGIAPLQTVTAGDAIVPLGLLVGASGALLAIVCANVGGILLSRHERRAHELGVRRAIGASQGRIVRLQMLEGASLGVLGTALGLPLAALLLHWVVASGVLQLPRLGEASLDLRLLLGAAALAVLVSSAVGLAPAWRWSRTRFAGMSMVRSEGGVVARSLGGGLIVTQVALCLALACGASLLVRSLERLQRVDVGFDAESLLTFSVSRGTELEAPPIAERRAFFDRLLEEARLLPGVLTVDLFAGAPARRSGWSTYVVREEDGDAKEPFDGVGRRIVGTGAIEALGLRIESGRSFAATDTADDPLVVMVSAGLARQLWPDEDPVGRRVQVGGLENPDTWWRVIGVVSDARFDGPRRDTPLQVYLAADQFPPVAADVLVRYEGEPTMALAAVREAVRRVDPSTPLVGVATMRELLARDLAEPGLFTALFAAFSLLALSLTGVGLYASVASAVARRRREIAIRMALGATPATMTGQVLRQGMLLVGLGVVAGLALAEAGGRLLANFVFGISTADPISRLAAVAAVAIVAGLACWVPGARAARTDPAVTLRDP